MLSDGKVTTCSRLEVLVMTFKNPVPNDINCWQRPEDMGYKRPVSVCDETASDLAGKFLQHYQQLQ
ncbi:hypothetical protein CRYUN_Cryun27aG0033600 [Craigia yunnanensis]